MSRSFAVPVVGAVLSISATAFAASGSIDDPKGDYPDIVELAYNNADSKVVMKATYAGEGQNGRAQNESFYMRWGNDAQNNYQVFISSSASKEEFRYNGKKAGCGQLVVKHPTKRSTKVVVPRTCLSKAPNKLRFQAIATEGLYSVDETKLTKAIARG